MSVKLIERDVLMRPTAVSGAKLPEGVLRRIEYPIANHGVKNRNNRVYEKAVFERVLSDAEVQEKIKTRSLFGNAEHPSESQVKLDPDTTSHVVTEIRVENDKSYAVVDLLNTKAGQFINALFEAGCGVGTSTRADGELEEKVDESGNKFSRVIPESYKFLTLDFTGDPSTIGSYPTEIQDNIVRNVRAGLESKKMDASVAQILLESVKPTTDEGKSLLESAKKSVTEAEAGATKSAGQAEKADGQGGQEIAKAGGQGDQQNKGAAAPSVTSSQKEGEKADGQGGQEIAKAGGKAGDRNSGGSTSTVNLPGEGCTAESKGVTTSVKEDVAIKPEGGETVKVDANGTQVTVTSTPAVNPVVVPPAEPQPVLPPSAEVPQVVDGKEKENTDGAELTPETDFTNEESFESVKAELRTLKARNAILVAERNKAIEMLEQDPAVEKATAAYIRDITDLTQKLESTTESLKDSQMKIKQMNTKQMQMVAEHKQALVKKYAETCLKLSGLSERLSQKQISVVLEAKDEAEADRLIDQARSALREARINGSVPLTMPSPEVKESKTAEQSVLQETIKKAMSGML